MPKVSFVIPAYNIESYIGRCIQSVKNQTFGDFEAIIVDDASTDSTPEKIVTAVGDDSRFRLSLIQPIKASIWHVKLLQFIQKASGSFA